LHASLQLQRHFDQLASEIISGGVPKPAPPEILKALGLPVVLQPALFIGFVQPSEETGLSIIVRLGGGA
jgi:hypothetical protein